MSLRLQAELDLAVTLEDPSGFGWPITLVDPSGFAGSAQLYGQSGDVGLLIDPDTGEALTGRVASVSLRISSITAAGFAAIPEGIPAANSKPWKMTFADINGSGPHTFRVERAYPDRTLGVVKSWLRVFRT